MHGQCNSRPMVTFPATEHHRYLAGTKVYCLVTKGTCMWTTSQSRYMNVKWLWVIPVTFWSQVWCLSHYIIMPHINKRRQNYLNIEVNEIIPGLSGKGKEKQLWVRCVSVASSVQWSPWLLLLYWNVIVIGSYNKWRTFPSALKQLCLFEFFFAWNLLRWITGMMSYIFTV